MEKRSRILIGFFTGIGVGVVIALANWSWDRLIGNWQKYDSVYFGFWGLVCGIVGLVIGVILSLVWGEDV